MSLQQHRELRGVYVRGNAALYVDADTSTGRAAETKGHSLIDSSPTASQGRGFMGGAAQACYSLTLRCEGAGWY